MIGLRSAQHLHTHGTVATTEAHHAKTHVRTRPRQAGGRWEDRGGDNRNSARPAPRGAAGDKFARGPKQFGASNFKPHGAAGEGPAGKRGGTRVLKITRG